MVLPPPNATTTSEAAARAAATPARAVSTVGSPETEKVVARTPAAVRASSTARARSLLLPVTTRAPLGAPATSPAAIAPTSRAHPAPKAIRVGAASSNARAGATLTNPDRRGTR